MNKDVNKKIKQEDVVSDVKDPLIDTETINGFWKETFEEHEVVKPHFIENIIAFIMTFIVVTGILGFLFVMCFSYAMGGAKLCFLLTITLTITAFPIFIFIAQKIKKISKGIQWGILTPIILILIALILLLDPRTELIGKGIFTMPMLLISNIMG